MWSFTYTGWLVQVGGTGRRIVRLGRLVLQSHGSATNSIDDPAVLLEQGGERPGIGVDDGVGLIGPTAGEGESAVADLNAKIILAEPEREGRVESLCGLGSLIGFPLSSAVHAVRTVWTALRLIRYPDHMISV
jgi:hypothetical protein